MAKKRKMTKKNSNPQLVHSNVIPKAKTDKSNKKKKSSPKYKIKRQEISTKFKMKKVKWRKEKEKATTFRRVHVMS